MNNDWIESDVNRIQPTSLAHIEGQEQLTESLNVNLKAFFNVRSVKGNECQAFGPVMLTGPSGTGKTMVARAIHTELGNLRLYHTNGEAVNSKRELFMLLMSADEHTTVFIDEAQGMNAKAQHYLLTAISEGFLPISSGLFRYQPGIMLDRFTLILATTHEYLLQDALRNRMRIYCRFQRYSIEAIVGILRQRAKALGWQYESDQVLLDVASRSKGVPRIALNKNLQMCWQVAQSHNRDLIMLSDVNEAFSYLQIDELGLEDIDRQYLQVLYEDGHVALNVISSKLGLPPKTVQSIVETYLIRENLITKDRQSMRVLTSRGKKHLEGMA